MIYSADESATATAGAAAAEIALTMKGRRQYRITASSAAGLWYRVVKPGAAGADTVAVAGAGSHYLPASKSHLVAPIADRTRIAVIREAATDGLANLSEVVTVVSQASP